MYNISKVLSSEDCEVHNCKAALFITALAFQKQAKEPKLKRPRAGHVLGTKARGRRHTNHPTCGTRALLTSAWCLAGVFQVELGASGPKILPQHQARLRWSFRALCNSCCWAADSIARLPSTQLPPPRSIPVCSELSPRVPKPGYSILSFHLDHLPLAAVLRAHQVIRGSPRRGIFKKPKCST